MTWWPSPARYGATCLPALPLPPVKKMRMPLRTYPEGAASVPEGRGYSPTLIRLNGSSGSTAGKTRASRIQENAISART